MTKANEASGAACGKCGKPKTSSIHWTDLITDGGIAGDVHDFESATEASGGVKPTHECNRCGQVWYSDLCLMSCPKCGTSISRIPATATVARKPEPHGELIAIGQWVNKCPCTCSDCTTLRMFYARKRAEFMMRTMGRTCQCWLCIDLNLPCDKCESCTAQTATRTPAQGSDEDEFSHLTAEQRQAMADEARNYYGGRDKS